MRSVSAFFALTFGVSWTLFALTGVWLASLPPGSAATALRTPLLLLGTITPSIIAVLLTWRSEGRDGVAALLRPILHWRVPLRWYVFAVGYMALVKLSAALLLRAATGAWPRFGDTPLYVMIAGIAVSTWVQAGEEIGWRGYALPRMSARMGVGPASLVLGIIWALWHLPGFVVPGLPNSGQSLPIYVLQVTAISVAMAWLLWRTGGSLLLVMLMHASINNTTAIVPSAVQGAADPFTLYGSTTGWLTVVLLWLPGLWFLARMRRATLARRLRDGTPA